MQELFEIADEEGIETIYGDYPDIKSMSCGKYIALDANLTSVQERSCYAHELGHCVRGAFYTRKDSAVVRAQCEHKADKWAIKKLVPEDELERAVNCGHTEIWDLADYFNVTEELMRKAVCLYKYGTLATEYYFAS